MAVTGTYLEMAVADRITSRIVQLVFTGNYTQQANGGEILDLKNILNSGAGIIFDGIKTWSGRRPLVAWPLTASGGYSFELIPVANQPTQFIVKIFAPGGLEAANATAYTALTGTFSAGKSIAAPDSVFTMGFDVATGT